MKNRSFLYQKHFSSVCVANCYVKMLLNDKEICRRIVLYGVGMDLSQIYHVETITISGDKDSGIECSVDFTNDITQ